MLQLVQENNQLKEDKIRIMGVNQILEQKIQVDRSERMTLQNDVNNLLIKGSGSFGKLSSNRKLGAMSSYLRKQQVAIRSMKGSQMEFDRESVNDRKFMKNFYKNQGRASAYRERLSEYSKMTGGSGNKIVVDDLESDNDSRMDAGDVRSTFIRKSVRSSVRGSVKSRSMKSSRMAHNRVQVIRDFESDDESVADIGEQELGVINAEIMKKEQ
jgi:hypothetical protein